MQNESCDILIDAIKRYKRIIKRLLRRDQYARTQGQTPNIVEHPIPEFRSNPNFGGFIDEVTINLKKPCEELPHANMDEACKLMIVKNADAMKSK